VFQHPACSWRPLSRAHHDVFPRASKAALGGMLNLVHNVDRSLVGSWEYFHLLLCTLVIIIAATLNRIGIWWCFLVLFFLFLLLSFLICNRDLVINMLVSSNQRYSM
jgi:hypothetical protein